MKQTFKRLSSTLLRSLMLLTILVTGSASAWGEVKTYQHVFNVKPSTGNEVQLSGVKWDISATNLGSYNSSNYAGVQFGSSKNDGEIKLTSSSSWSYSNANKIIEVRLWLNLGGTSVTPSVTIGGVAATSDGTTVVKNSSAGADWTKATKVTFTPSADGNTGVVIIDVKSVKAGYICAMEIDCEQAQTGKTQTSTSFPQSKYTAFLGESFTSPTATVSGGTGLVPVYSSSNTSVATVNASTGAVALVAAGTTTITASYAGNATYESSSASYTLTVGKVYENLAALVADGAPTSAGVPVKVTLTDETIQSIAINRDATSRLGIYLKSGEQEVEIYCTGVPQTWAAGGKVSGIITGTWKLYSSTWEVAISDWSQLSYTAASVLQSISLEGTPTKTDYKIGESFSPAGLSVIATYEGEQQTSDVTSQATFTYDNSALTLGTNSVNVTAQFGGKEASHTYDITVSKKTPIITIANMEIGKNESDVVISAVTTPADAELTYSITDGAAYVTLSENKISAKAPGTATIKASYAGNDEYASAEKSFTVTVLDKTMVTYTFSSFTSKNDVVLTDLDGFIITLSKGEGTAMPTWASSEARVYAKGSLKVKSTNADILSIVYTYSVNANKNGVTPTIDSVEGTSNAGTWNAENKTWTGSDNEVTFSTSGAAGNIGFTKLVITYAQGSKTETTLAWSASEATVTIDANDNVFPTLTTNPANLEGVTYESSKTSVATIASDGTITLVAPGTTTITAKYVGDATHTEAAPASYSLTVNAAPFVPQVVAAGYETVDFLSIYSGVTTNATVETYYGTSFMMEFAKPTSSTTPTKYYNTGKSVRAYEGNTITITAAENIKYVNIAWTAEKGEDTGVQITGIGTKTAVVTFSATCSFSSITVGYQTTNIVLAAKSGDDYYATFSSTGAVQLIDAVVYTVNVAEGVLTLSEIKSKSVPANTGVLIKTSTTAASYGIIPSASALSNNLLKPASEAMSGSNKFYKLAYADWDNKTGLGFYWGAADGAAFTCKEGGAYLAVPASQAAEIHGFSFDDMEEGMANGIKSVSSDNAVDSVYTLEGKKLDATMDELPKGIYLVNGKKVVKF